MRKALLIALLLIAAPLQLIQHEDAFEAENEDKLVINRSPSPRPYITTVLESNHYHASVNTMFFERINETGQVPSPGESELFAAGWACAMSANPPDECSLSDSTGTNISIPDGVMCGSPLFAGSFKSNGSFNGVIGGSCYGDRVDAMIQLSNGDMLYGGSFCWVGGPAQSCNLSNSGVQLDPIANDDAFILRVDSNGTWKWGQVLGGLGSWDIVTDLAEAPNGDIYAMISYCNQNNGNECEIESDLSYTNTTVGEQDLLLVKISSSGSMQWARNMGSPANDAGIANHWYPLRERGLFSTPDGGVIVASSGCQGEGQGCSFEFNDDDYFVGHKSFIAKYDADGDIEWFEEIPAAFLQTMSRVDEHTVLIAGNHFTPVLTLGALSIAHANSGTHSDAWWATYNHTSRTWESLQGSNETADVYLHSSAVGPKGEIILGGSACWSVTPCDIDIGGLNASNLGYGTGFIVKLNHSSDDAWIMTIEDSTTNPTAINQLEVSQWGDIGFSGRICEQGGSTCAVSIDGYTYSPQGDNGTLVVRVKQDADYDGLYHARDNCPNGATGWFSNTTTDIDGDGCRDIDEDQDDDGDGFLDTSDGCPLVFGNSSSDREGCIDSDGDGWSDPDSGWNADDGADAFPNNVTQWRDSDGDGYGDNHYYDVDPVTGLYVNQSGDGSPLDSEQWSDMDGDGYGDNDQSGTHYDDCPYTYGLSSENDRFGCVDNDGDGWANEDDDYPFEETQWSDQDEDGYGDNPAGTSPDACPTAYGTSTIDGNLGCPDIDGDGWPDSSDAFPNDQSQWNDTDGDGFGDEPDGVDGDDCVNIPGNSTMGLLGCIDADGDGWADSEDDLPENPSQWEDSDSDGYGNNPDGTNPDGCPTQAGTSYIDTYGCADYDSDGWSGQTDVFPFDPTQWSDQDNDGYGDNASGDYADNCPTIANGVDEDNQADYDLDGAGDACDTDDDGDGILDSTDSCPSGITDWTSTSVTDYDQDGCLDNTEDDDDDNDGVPDDADLCQKSNEIFNSSSLNDHDTDGCLDSNEEDSDDDNDDVLDIKDLCPKGESNWVSTLSADWDGDGCKDDVEDSDDDNDGLDDDLDSCPTGLSQWEDQRAELDLDMDGCLDGRESPLQQGSGVVDEQYYLDLIANQSQEDERTFVEQLAAGDLDAIGLVFTILFALVSISGTILIRARKTAFLRGLERSIMTAVDLEDLDQAKKDIRRAAKNDQISTNRYELMMDDLNDRRETLIQERDAAQRKKTKGPPKKSPPKRTPPTPKATPEPELDPEPLQEEEEYFTPPEDQITTGDDGYRYWEDQNGQWWVEMDGEWTQWG